MKTLHILPVRTAGAAENMALDFLLLQRYPEPAAPRFRHYEWRAPAFTFGFGQKIIFVRENLAAHLPADLCRRPTGGGIVDHRNDWTYALVLPRGHALYEARATQSYHIVHACLAGALVTLGQPAVVKTEGQEIDPDGSDLGRDKLLKSRAPRQARGPELVERASTRPQPPPGICFQRAELYDVVNARTGAKIAGAAQKRNKHGLLFQGSIEKGGLARVDWDDFQARFTAALAQALGAESAGQPWPDLDENEVSGLIEQYSAPEWVEYR